MVLRCREGQPVPLLTLQRPPPLEQKPGLGYSHLRKRSQRTPDQDQDQGTQALAERVRKEHKPLTFESLWIKDKALTGSWSRLPRLPSPVGGSGAADNRNLGAKAKAQAHNSVGEEREELNQLRSKLLFPPRTHSEAQGGPWCPRSQPPTPTQISTPAGADTHLPSWTQRQSDTQTL